MEEILLVSVAFLVAGLVKYGDGLLRITRRERWIGDVLFGLLFMMLAGLMPLLGLPPMGVVYFVIVFLPVYVLVSRLVNEFQIRQRQRKALPRRQLDFDFDLNLDFEFHILDAVSVILLVVIAVFTVLTVIQFG